MATLTGTSTLSNTAVLAAVLKASTLRGTTSFYVPAHLASTLHRPGETQSLGLVINGEVGYVTNNFVLPSGTVTRRSPPKKNLSHPYTQAAFRQDIDGTTLKATHWDVFNADFEGSAATGQSVKVEGNLEGTTCPDDGGCMYICDEMDTGTWIFGEATGEGGCGDCGECEDPPSSDTIALLEAGAGTCSDGSAGHMTPYSITCDQLLEVTGGGSSGSSVAVQDGHSEWVPAGSLNEQVGIHAPQERAMQMVTASPPAHLAVSSGILTPKGFTILASVLPSGDPADTVIMSKQEQRHSHFTLGVDFDGRYYVRSDAEVHGEDVPHYARSANRYDSYKQPSEIMAVYASGDSRLHIYVNGLKEDSSASFQRNIKGDANTRTIIGKRKTFAERGFTGWIDRLSISSKSSLTDQDIQDYYDSKFNLARFVRQTVPPDSGSFGGGSFDTSFFAVDKDYIQLTVESGNSYGILGGIFDLNSGLQVSSVYSFDLDESPPNFHQLRSITVEAWVENRTSHPSGANVFASVVNDEKPEISYDNLNWRPSGLYVPSGGPIKLTFNHPLDSDLYYPGGYNSSYKAAFDQHQLKLAVTYPSGTVPFDAEFKIYSTRVIFNSFERFSRLNTFDGLSVAGSLQGQPYTTSDGGISYAIAGDKSLSLMMLGNVALTHVGNMNMFVDAHTAAQSMPLVLNRTSLSSMGDTSVGTLTASGTIVTYTTWPLFIKGGTANASMNLYARAEDFLSRNKTLELYTEGGTDLYPRIENSIPLFLKESVAGEGSLGSTMNLAFPNVGAGKIADKRLLYVEGRKPTAVLNLALKAPVYSTETRELYISGPSQIKSSGIMNLFLKRHGVDAFGRMVAVPTVLTDDNMNLFAKGHGVAESTVGLQATGTVTITDFTELNSTDKVNLIATDGTNYDFTNGDQSSVAGTWESATSNDQTATNLMNVINTSSGPAGTRFSASVVGAVVTITQNTVGAAGNTAITLTDTGSAGMTKADFAGGTHALNLVIPNTIGPMSRTNTLHIRGHNI